MTDRGLLTIADYEALSREILPRQLFDVLFGGQRWIRGEYQQHSRVQPTRLRPRVMAGIPARKLSTNVLGQRIERP